MVPIGDIPNAPNVLGVEVYKGTVELPNYCPMEALAKDIMAHVSL